MTSAGTTLTLKQFMLRKQVLKLYRDFFRASRQIGDPRQRRDIDDWVRKDFKAAAAAIRVDDEETIKNAVYNGEKMLREMRQSLDLADAGKRD